MAALWILVVQRVIEFLSSIPRIPLWMTLAAVMPTDWSSVRIYFGIITILAFLGLDGHGARGARQGAHIAQHGLCYGGESGRRLKRL